MSKTSDIDEAIFKSIHPILGSKGARLAGQILKGAIKATIRVDLDGDSKPDSTVNVSVPDIKLPDYLRIDNNFILVFDDLERCKLKIEEVLGYINYFVEQESIKTLIISNATEIQQNEYFLKIKEKLIGATFNYTEDQDLAIQSILNEVLDGDLKTLITSNLELTKQIFNQVGYQNLRSFKQTVFDFKRFYKKEFFEWNGNFESEIFEKVLKAFLILSLENKKGRFEKEILNFKLDELEPTADEKRKRALRHLSSFVGEDAQKFQKKYQMRLNEYIFSKNLWNEVLNLNIIDKKKINSELYNAYFRFKENQPTWFKLMNFFDLDEIQFDHLVQLAKEEIEQDQLKNTTDILHTISMLIYLEHHSLICFSVEDLIVQTLDHIKNTFEINETMKKIEDYNFREYSGQYGFYAKELDLFISLMNDIVQAYEDKYSERDETRVKELLELMEENGWLFYERISLTNSFENYYYNYPILKKIEAEEFAQKLCTVNTSNTNSILYGLSNRYTTKGHINMYAEEKNWFDNVENSIRKEILPSANKILRAKINLTILPKILQIKEDAT